MNDEIQQLKKVTIALTLHPDVGDAGGGGAARLSFHHGIAAEGLSGLEMALSGHKAGDRLHFASLSEPLGDFFGRQLPLLRAALGGALPKPPLTLEVEVLAVEEASQRDLVQAMARSLAHGCGGGGCDCGCAGD